MQLLEGLKVSVSSVPTTMAASEDIVGKPVPFTYTKAVAPLINQSDLAFRLLCRQNGADVAYTQMLLAKQFCDDTAYREKYHEQHPDDHPLVVQFAGDVPEHIVCAALIAQDRGADAIDLNLGCPQSAAKEGHYGAWMTDPTDWPLCASIVRALATCPALRLPVFCKIRLQQTLEATMAFARMLQSNGCSLLVVHGRQRGGTEKRRAGAADLDAIAAVRAALRIPVVSNGNVRSHAEYHAAMSTTGCVGVMSGEGILRDPSLFSCTGRPCAGQSTCATPSPPDGPRAYSLMCAYLRLAELYPPPAWATVLQHCSWMLGRTGHSGHVHYALLDPARKVSGKYVRQELTYVENGDGETGVPLQERMVRLRDLIDLVLGAVPSKAERKRREQARRMAAAGGRASASGGEEEAGDVGALPLPSSAGLAMHGEG